MSEDKIIVQAVLTKEGKIVLTVNGSHTPSLSYIHKLLGVEIDKRIINEQLAQSPIVAPSKHGIINFIRKGVPRGG